MRVWTIHLESSINETQGNPVQDFCGILVGECHVLLTRLRNRKYGLLKLKNLLTQKLTFRLLLEKTNASWLRSFGSAWGLGGKRVRMKR